MGLLVHDANQELDCVERECFIFSVFSFHFFFWVWGILWSLQKFRAWWCRLLVLEKENMRGLMLLECSAKGKLFVEFVGLW